MTITAVILPCRDNFRHAIEEAILTDHQIQAKLYTDGERVAWLPRKMPGWFRVGAIEHRSEACAA